MDKIVCKWEQSVGVRVKVTDTIYFTKHEDISVVQKAIYGRIVLDYFPQKEYPYLTCLIVGVNLINFPGEVGTLMVDMLTYKFLFDSVLPTPYAKFMAIDIKKSTSTRRRPNMSIWD